MIINYDIKINYIILSKMTSINIRKLSHSEMDLYRKPLLPETWSCFPVDRDIDTQQLRKVLQKDLDKIMGKLHKTSILNRDVKILGSVRLSCEEKVGILKSSRIIVMGDFNSHYLKRKPGTLVKYKPFSLVNKVVKAQNVASCCFKTLDVFYNEPCDYVFDSKYKKENITEVPTNYDYKKIYSDHLPVVYLTK